MKLLTWNIGSFVTRRRFRFFLKDSERFEYFQPELNAKLVADTIEQMNPDFFYKSFIISKMRKKLRF